MGGGKNFHVFLSPHYMRVIIIIIIIGSTALGGPWPPQANVASDPYPGHPPANFYNPISLCLPLHRQSILISVDHFLVVLRGLSTILDVRRSSKSSPDRATPGNYWIKNFEVLRVGVDDVEEMSVVLRGRTPLVLY